MADAQYPGHQACSVEVSRDGAVGVITLSGAVGVEAEPNLTSGFRQASDGVKRVRWTFRPGTTINSAGIAVLITLTSQARQSRIVVEIAGLSPHYRRIFDMIGLTEYVKMVE